MPGNWLPSFAHLLSSNILASTEERRCREKNPSDHEKWRTILCVLNIPQLQYSKIWLIFKNEHPLTRRFLESQVLILENLTSSEGLRIISKDTEAQSRQSAVGSTQQQPGQGYSCILQNNPWSCQLVRWPDLP